MVDKEADDKEYMVDIRVSLASNKAEQVFWVFQSTQDHNHLLPKLQKVLSIDKLQKVGMLRKVFLHIDTIQPMAMVAFSPLDCFLFYYLNRYILGCILVLWDKFSRCNLSR